MQHKFKLNVLLYDKQGNLKYIAARTIGIKNTIIYHKIIDWDTGQPDGFTSYSTKYIYEHYIVL